MYLPRHRGMQNFPIPHLWVTETFAGMGEREYSTFVIVLTMIYHVDLTNLLCHQRLWTNSTSTSLPSSVTGKSNKLCLHSLRVILHLGPPPLDSVHPIGVSKQSCFCCVLWIESHNRIFRTQWMTSGFHGKPYANWALPGGTCSYAIEADEEFNRCIKGCFDTVDRCAGLALSRSEEDIR
jgi:hypothetical protein